MTQPQIIVIAGPNGAGKSTASALLVPPEMPFLNADEIAKGLPGYPSQGADMEAGKICLSRMDDLEENHGSFAFETTLASRSLAPRVARLRRSGYHFRLAFAFLPDPDLAVARVAGRVRQGGHNIPEETIRRRYRARLKNFFELYQPLADKWSVYDTTHPSPIRLIAEYRIGERSRSRTPYSGTLCKKGRTMDNQGRGLLGDPDATGEQIRQAWERAGVAAMEVHRRTGVPVVTWDWDNGRVVLIPVDEIPTPVEHSLAAGDSSDRKV